MARYKINADQAQTGWEQLTDLLALGLPQYEIAAMMCVAKNAIYQWKRRRHNITPPFLPLLALIHSLATSVAAAQGAGFVRPFFHTASSGLGGTPYEAIVAGSPPVGRLRAAVRQFPGQVRKLGIEPVVIEPFVLEPTGSKAADRLSAVGFGAADLAVIAGAEPYIGPSALLRAIANCPETEAKFRIAARIAEDLRRQYSGETVRVLLMWELPKLNLGGSIARVIASSANPARQLRRATDVILSRQVRLHQLV